MKINLKSSICFFVFSSLLFSCSKNLTKEKNYLWIDQKRVSCTGIIEQTCYRVQHGAVLGNNWEYFYDGINGFDEQYEPGYIYKLEVNIKKIENPPADGSSLEYGLVKILSKEKAK
jgi:hypothetical protein